MGLLQNYMKIFVLNMIWLMNKIKAYLGIIPVKYGLFGYYKYKGVVFTSWMNPEARVAACETYDNFRPDDVILMTYPKTGTHFTGEIIGSIWNEAKGTKIQVMGDKMLGLEMEMFKPADPNKRFASIDAAPSPRCLVSHLPWNLLPKRAQEGKVKVVHCMRNPKDTVCSYYPFINKMKMLESMTFKEFFLHFIDGNVPSGGYLDYVRSWYPFRNEPSVCNLFFEDMKKDLEGTVRKLAKFLEVELTQEQVDRVVTANTFENKKKAAGKGHVIYRSGASGGWRADLTVEQNAIMDAWIETGMKDMPDVQWQNI